MEEWYTDMYYIDNHGVLYFYLVRTFEESF